jgi:four helix bundle protein
MMNGGQKRDLPVRTKALALRIIRLYAMLPKTTEAQVRGRQLLRSGTSVGAHYREAMRARSTAEFIQHSYFIV